MTNLLDNISEVTIKLTAIAELIEETVEEMEKILKEEVKNDTGNI